MSNQNKCHHKGPEEEKENERETERALMGSQQTPRPLCDLGSLAAAAHVLDGSHSGTHAGGERTQGQCV